MSAAFDTLNHSTLINRLVNIGFRDDAFNWLKSYITEISCYVSIDNMKSKKCRLRECFSKISNWCEYNSLKLNHVKTNAMFIVYRKKSTHV